MERLNQQLKSDIGGRIAHSRKRAGITQEELAEKLSCSVKHMSEVERGLSSFSLEKLLEVSDYLDCSLDYLIRGNNRSFPEAQLPNYISEVFCGEDSREKELLLEYLRLYPKLRSKECLGQ